MEAALAGYAEGVLKSSLGKLGSFLLNEALLIGSVCQDIQFIRDELLSMDAVLQDVMRSGQLNQQTKAWMLQVLELACDAELCTDEFTEKVGTYRIRGFAAAVWHYVCSVPTVVPRYRIAKTIKGLKSRAQEVSERRSRYSTTIAVEDTTKSQPTRETGKRFSHQNQYNNLMGIDNDATQLNINFLFPNNVAFLGPIGSGKTAHARIIYHKFSNNMLDYYIRLSAWVTVPREADMKWVPEQILEQVSKKPIQGIEKFNLIMLSDKLRRELENKRFLIVLDSLWSVEQWQTLRAALPRNGHVLVTTRNEDVADIVKDRVVKFESAIEMPSDPVIKKEVKEQFWKFFVDLLPNGTAEEPYKNFWREVKKSFLLRPCPTPLELKCICGSLAGVPIKVGQYSDHVIDLLEIPEDTIDTEERIRKVVMYCWRDHLPSLLKPLCQDINFIPEGYAISRKLLMRWWIAKGHITPRRGFRVEEVAESYFDELVSRFIIEPETVQPGSKIRRCLINSVFKEVIAPLLISNAPNSKSVNPHNNNQTDPNPETVNPVNNKQVPNPQISSPVNDRHVPDPDPASFQLYNINTSSKPAFVRKHLFLKEPELLTFLDLEGCMGLSKTELSLLCQFVQLRFLSLRNTDVAYLPEKIGKLKLLETLDIRQTKIKKVPGGIVSLNRLKHLLAGYFYKPERTTGTHFVSCSTEVEVPVGIEKMHALETLAHVNVTRSSEILFVMRELTQLRKVGLVIREKELNPRPLCITIMMLSASLRSLSVCYELEGGSLGFLEYMCFPPQKLESLNIRGHLTRLPQWVADHIRLTKITLSLTQLSSDDFELLGKIPSLRCLKLYSDSCREDELVFSKDKFKSLQVLVVNCDAIRTINFKEGTPHCLEVFEWVMSHPNVSVLGAETLPMLKYVSFIGSENEDPEFVDNTKALFSKHDNYKSLVLKFILNEKE